MALFQLAVAPNVHSCPWGPQSVPHLDMRGQRSRLIRTHSLSWAGERGGYDSHICVVPESGCCALLDVVTV